MKATGTIKITDELTLLNPTLEINTVTYNWSTNKVDIEVLFLEGVFPHSRTFSFDTEGKEKTKADIRSYIKNHEILKVFK